MRTRRFGPLDVQVPVIASALEHGREDRTQRSRRSGAGRASHGPHRHRRDVRERQGRGARRRGERRSTRRLFLFEGAPAARGRGGDPARLRGEPAQARHRPPDLYLMHWRGDVPLAETIGAFEALREGGRSARGACRTSTTRISMSRADRARRGRLQPVLYHLRERNDRAPRDPVVRAARRGVVAYSPFGSRGGFPNSKGARGVAARLGATPRQAALAYLTRRPSVFAIPKTSRVAHVEELARRRSLDPRRCLDRGARTRPSRSALARPTDDR